MKTLIFSLICLFQVMSSSLLIPNISFARTGIVCDRASTIEKVAERMNGRLGEATVAVRVPNSDPDHIGRGIMTIAPKKVSNLSIATAQYTDGIGYTMCVAVSDDE